MDDLVTRYAREFFRLLLLKRPVQTSLGGALGFAMWGLMQFFGPALDSSGLVDRAAVPPLAVVALGIVLAHIPTFVTFFFKPTSFDEEIEQAFVAIERAQENGLPQLQAGIQYLDLVRKVQERVVYRKEIQDELKESQGSEPRKQAQK